MKYLVLYSYQHYDEDDFSGWRFFENKEGALSFIKEKISDAQRHCGAGEYDDPPDLDDFMLIEYNKEIEIIL